MSSTNAPQAKRPTDSRAGCEPGHGPAEADGKQSPPLPGAVEDEKELQSEIDAEDAQMRHESAM